MQARAHIRVRMSVIKFFAFTVFFAECSAFQTAVSPMLRSTATFSSTKQTISFTASNFRFSGARQNLLELRAEVTPTPQKNEAPSLDSLELNTVEAASAESPSVLSDEELEARIAAAGLDRIDPSIKEAENLTPIEQAMKKSATLGKGAIATAANSAISVLNKLEKPIDENEWKAIAPKPVEEQSTSMLSNGGGFVALPVFIIGGMLGYWALASELNWF